MMKNYIHTLLVITSLSYPLSVYAGPFVTLNNPTPAGGNTFQDFIYLLVQITQMIGVPLLVVCLIYAGFLMVTASGNEEQLKKSKLWFIWTVVGATIILGARVLADLIKGTASAF